jgi:hypothetical protein
MTAYCKEVYTTFMTLNCEIGFTLLLANSFHSKVPPGVGRCNSKPLFACVYLSKHTEKSVGGQVIFSTVPGHSCFRVKMHLPELDCFHQLMACIILDCILVITHHCQAVMDKTHDFCKPMIHSFTAMNLQLI